MRKIDTLVADFPDIYKLTGQDEVSKTFIRQLPKAEGGQRRAEGTGKTDDLLIIRQGVFEIIIEFSFKYVIINIIILRERRKKCGIKGIMYLMVREKSEKR